MSKRILVIEDEVRISNLLKMYLERESYAVDTAYDGEEGLRKAMQSDYDLILLDVFLPERNGYSVLEMLRQTKDTPVVMLSAQNGPADEQKRKSLGVSDIIAKPFSPRDVVLKVNSFM